MNAPELQRKLRDAHGHAGRALADLEFPGLLTEDDDLIADRVYLLIERIRRMVASTHRDYGIHPNLDAVMALHAVIAFRERLAELRAVYEMPANDRETVN